MLGFFERQRLVRKGLASSKQRRRRTESELVQSLEHGHLSKLGVFAVFVLGLSFLILSNGGPSSTDNVLIGILIFAVALAQLWINHPGAWDSNSRLVLIFGVLLVHLAAVKWVLITADAQPLVEQQLLWRLAVPCSLAPLTLSVLLGRNHGIYATIFASLWTALVYRSLSDAKLLVMSLICGFIAVFVTMEVRRRSRLIRAGLFVGLATLLLALLFGLVGPINWHELSNNHWSLIGWQSVVAIGSGIGTALVIGGALPVLENLFGVTTNISWLELADLNHPLLRRMTIEAPGTYHHSLVVAQLAEAAAEAIGANPAIARVSAYFHDIGKLVKPEYFTENMRYGRNPHDELAPTMSALIILAHVKEGVDLALKNRLNQQIVDAIQQHHGTSLVFYFYKRALQQQEDARQGGKIMNIREEDIPEVCEESFRYPGPKPQSKECAILSLADGIESASRSIEKITPQKVDQLIDDIVQKRLLDDQLSDCDLSLRELGLVAESFKNTLHSMMHSRVAYPSDRTSEKRETPSPTKLRNLPPASAA
jgi:putative nucleotidyltransferase with HDIG domain